MGAQAIIEIQGKKYMSTRTAADLWEITGKRVAEYCREGRIVDKFKNGRWGWYIHVDEIKPLSEKDIQRILLLTLKLKNKPDYQIDWTSNKLNAAAIKRVYHSLVVQGYIEQCNTENENEIPYKAILTDKGFDLVTKGKTKKEITFVEALQVWIPIIVNVAELISKTQEWISMCKGA